MNNPDKDIHYFEILATQEGPLQCQVLYYLQGAELRYIEITWIVKRTQLHHANYTMIQILPKNFSYQQQPQMTRSCGPRGQARKYRNVATRPTVEWMVPKCLQGDCMIPSSLLNSMGSCISGQAVYCIHILHLCNWMFLMQACMCCV